MKWSATTIKTIGTLTLILVISNFPCSNNTLKNFSLTNSSNNPVSISTKAKAAEKGIENIAWEVEPLVYAKHKDLTASTNFQSATLCACAKCGSTSFWKEVFAITHGKSFASTNYKGPPWVHNLSNKKLWTNIQAKKKTDWSNFKMQNSFALIRDPKERLLSAWRDKVDCDRKPSFVTNFSVGLFELAGSSNITLRSAANGLPCLELSAYLQLLSQIHKQGKEGRLNNHFRPQHLGCFKDMPPSMWTFVATIGDPNSLCYLKSVLLGSSNTSAMGNDCQMVKTHATKKESNNITSTDEIILEEITRKEYDMLEQYL